MGEKKGTDTKKGRTKADQAVPSLAAPALVKLSPCRAKFILNSFLSKLAPLTNT